MPNPGLGLVGYTWEENGPSLAARAGQETLEQSVEALASLPFVDVLYIRCDWRDVQSRPGRLDLQPVWAATHEAARRHGLRVAFRVQLSNPEIQPAKLALPDFLQKKVPLVTIRSGSGRGPERVEPRYDHPEFQRAFRELNELLAAELDADPLVEFADLMMYGFWGEGHTSDYPSPIPDAALAERTFLDMTERQLAAWRRVPLVVNTQPDISRTGNRVVLERAVRGGAWLRSDSVILDEPEQIEELAHRPPWLAVVMEDGYHRHYRTDGERYRVDAAGVDVIEHTMLHALDLGANYWSLWTEAQNLARYRERRPMAFEALERRIGYRVRPSWVWQRKREGANELVVAFYNDGAASVPGILRVLAESRDGKRLAGGGLDAGHPFAGRVRLASFRLPSGLAGERRAAAGGARGQGSEAGRALGLRAAARRGRGARGEAQEVGRGGLAEGDMKRRSTATTMSSRGERLSREEPKRAGLYLAFLDLGGFAHQAPRERLACCLLLTVAGAFAVPVRAAEAPTPEMLRVLAPQAEGPRITPYLAYQLERAWAFDAKRQERFAQVKTEADLLVLQDELRRKALAVIGGLPQEKTPLNARVMGSVADGRLPHRQARVREPAGHPRERARLRARGRCRSEARGAARLRPLAELGKAHPRYQEIAVRLARRGYVVLCWDPVGQGERSQFWDRARGKSRYNLVCGEHAVLGNLATLAGTSLVRYKVWDGMRAVDYLLTRDDVDGERLAITGTSGGGFQSTWIGALDPRIRAVLPSCFPTALPMRMANRIFEDPDSDPEQDPPGLVSEGLDHPGLLLLTYPRPLHVSAAVLDFFPIEGTRKSMREVASFYSRFGHADDVALSEGYHKHQYSDENQAHAFAFLDRAFGRPAREGFEPVKTLPAEALRCAPSGQLREDLGGTLARGRDPRGRRGARREILACRALRRPRLPGHRGLAGRAARESGAARRDRLGNGGIGPRGWRRGGSLPAQPQRRARPAARAPAPGRRAAGQAPAAGRSRGKAARPGVDRSGSAARRGLRGRVLRPARTRRDAPALPCGLDRRSHARARGRGRGLRRPAVRGARQPCLQLPAPGAALPARARRGRRDRRALRARAARGATARDRRPGRRAPAGAGRRRGPARPVARPRRRPAAFSWRETLESGRETWPIHYLVPGAAALRLAPPPRPD